MEVFPQPHRLEACRKRLLHVRGGVSIHSLDFFFHFLSSPRPWRCFLLATLWALSLVCLLHVRGGVSAKVTIQRHGALSSPRPWRCFYNPALARGSFLVFSTSVEVFPVAGRTRSASGCLLHVRGGVSLGNFEVGATTGSSPRPWRCFCGPLPYAKSAQVFSTSVEVFPCRSASEKSRQQSSPRPWRCF